MSLSQKIADAVRVETVAGDLTVDDGRFQLTLDLLDQTEHRRRI